MLHKTCRCIISTQNNLYCSIIIYQDSFHYQGSFVVHYQATGFSITTCTCIRTHVHTHNTNKKPQQHNYCFTIILSSSTRKRYFVKLKVAPHAPSQSYFNVSACYMCYSCKELKIICRYHLCMRYVIIDL